jgi:hypothetical protein
MESESTIDATPKVGVLHRDHLAVALPAPVVGAPVVEAAVEHAMDVGTSGDKRQGRGLGECFKAANDGQQFKPLAMGLRLGVFDLDRVCAVGRF